MGTFIAPSDLVPFAAIPDAKATAMIEDAEANAILVAPCLSTLGTAPDGETEDEATVRLAKVAGVKAVLRRAILRWNEAGAGTTTQQVVGPFQTTFGGSRMLFWPSEIEQLQGMCKREGAGKAFHVDTAPHHPFDAHSIYCALHLGATYCDCGADIGQDPGE